MNTAHTQTISVRSLLQEAVHTLHDSCTDTAWLDSILLMSEVLGCTKEKLFTMYTDNVSDTVAESFRVLINRRRSGEPVAYIRGIQEFYGQEYSIETGVLVPRPDTETLVDAALTLIRGNARIRRIHDCCTGTGCVAIAIADAVRDCVVSASDISGTAVRVCRRNSRRILGKEIPVYRADLLQSMEDRFDLITANPPYLSPRDYHALRETGNPEPEIALLSGVDGLDCIRRLATQAVESLRSFGYLVLEHGFDQHSQVKKILQDAGYSHISVRTDIVGRDRVTIAKKAGV
jgi:release factor glutamine methyltransferase